MMVSRRASLGHWQWWMGESSPKLLSVNAGIGAKAVEDYDRMACAGAKRGFTTQTKSKGKISLVRRQFGHSSSTLYVIGTG